MSVVRNCSLTAVSYRVVVRSEGKRKGGRERGEKKRRESERRGRKKQREEKRVLYLHTHKETKTEKYRI